MSFSLTRKNSRESSAKKEVTNFRPSFSTRKRLKFTISRIICKEGLEPSRTNKDKIRWKQAALVDLALRCNSTFDGPIDTKGKGGGRYTIHNNANSSLQKSESVKRHLHKAPLHSVVGLAHIELKSCPSSISLCTLEKRVHNLKATMMLSVISRPGMNILWLCEIMGSKAFLRRSAKVLVMIL